MDGRCERLRVASVNPTRRAAANSIRLLTGFQPAFRFPVNARSLVQSGMICAATRASKRSWPAWLPRSRSSKTANDCDASERNPETFRGGSGE